jgi:hypothetical protein
VPFFRTPVTRANGSFVSSIPANRLFVFNEIGSFVPKKNSLGVASPPFVDRTAQASIQISSKSAPRSA